MDAAQIIEEEVLDDPDFASQLTAKVTAVINGVYGFQQDLHPVSSGLPSRVKDVQHVTPDEESLSSITVNISCPQGCPRTFANSSALRLHLKQVHHQSDDDSLGLKPGSNVWYHCPVKSCIYHEDMGSMGKHFPKLKYLKQHYLKVHATRSHTCECGKAFSTSALLAHHKRVCGISLMCVCGRNFSRFEALQTHARRMSHVIHSSTLQALRSRKIALSDPLVLAAQSATSHQDVWTHGIPIRYPRLEDGSKNDGSVGVTVSPSPSSSSRTIPQAICPAPASICPTPSTFTQVTSLNLRHPIHFLAAVALGEITVTAMKRTPCVDVGVQTEAEVMRRSRRKSSSPGRWEASGNFGSSTRNSNKRKRTTETQTRLTHRGNKKRNTDSCDLVPTKATIGGVCVEGTLEINGSTESETSFLEVSADNCSNSENSLESLTLQIDLPELISTQSSSGTQTSPRAGGLAHTSMHNISISLFDRACGDDEPTISPPSVTTITSTQTPHHLDPFAGSHLLMEEDEDLLDVVEDASSSINGHPPLLAHIRSSSIETQTDHDVLLSENAGTPDDVDEIILTNTETQTDPNNPLNMSSGSSYEPSNPCQASGTCDVHGTDSIWCTSETQTYEDFSDIEQFMRSTIHTQTPDHSHSELFPELSFTHTQTQTSIDDPPALVTTHTQTPTHYHFPTDLY
ncbi:ATM interactor [Palaemon carinicauda]|uniref:ATM interactor n=1 Tax=Palaemon carinicauda TaxID=392227 RepID=UPI0035B59910